MKTLELMQQIYTNLNGVLGALESFDMKTEVWPKKKLRKGFELLSSANESSKGRTLMLGSINVRQTLSKLALTLSEVRNGISTEKLSNKEANKYVRTTLSELASINTLLKKEIDRLVKLQPEPAAPAVPAKVVAAAPVGKKLKSLQDLRSVFDKKQEEEKQEKKAITLSPGVVDNTSIENIKNLIEEYSPLKNSIPKKIKSKDEDWELFTAPVFVLPEPMLKIGDESSYNFVPHIVVYPFVLLPDQMILAMDDELTDNKVKMNQAISDIIRSLKVRTNRDYVNMVSSHNEGGATKPFRFTGSELSYVWLIDKKVYHKLGSFTVKYVNFPFVMPHVATKKDEKTKTEELRKKRLALEKELDKQAAPLDKKRVELENILDSYVSQRDKIKEEKFKPAQDRLDLIKHFDKDNSEKMRLEEQRDEAREDIKELEEEARNIRAKIKALDAKRERMWAKLVKQAATK